MSDCFNHALDAYDSWDMGNREDGYGFSYQKRYISTSFLRIVHTTDRAILVAFDRDDVIIILGREELPDERQLPFFKELQVWIPKSVVKEDDIDNNYIKVHRRTVSNNIKNVLLKMFPRIKF